MSVSLCGRFKPVLRRPRREWRIPTIGLYVPSAQPDQETRIRRLCEGTTPQGREVFRKLLDRACTMTVANQNTAEAIAQLESRLGAFPEFHQEFRLLFSRICGRQEPSGELTTHDLAALIVLRARLYSQARQPQTTTLP